MSETDGSPGGEAVNPDLSDGGADLEGQDKSLEAKDATELVSIIRELRAESGKYRTKAKSTEEKLSEATSQMDVMAARLAELESQNKTVEEQEAERLAALEAKADLVSALQPYHHHVKAQYEAGFSEVEGLKDEDQKARYMDLLGSFPEDDYLGRLRAIRALEVAQPKTGTMDPGDQGNPGEPGGGAKEASLVDRLSWSEAGLREARLAGLIK
jgi:hypothetical protein